MEAKFWIELVAAASIPIGVIAVVYHRTKLDKGMGLRAIQFLGAATIPGLILVLALEGILNGAALASLVGTFVGYVLSSVNREK